MREPLDLYQQKRNFKATPEPDGRSGKRVAKKVTAKKVTEKKVSSKKDSAQSEVLGFVIQKHAASHLHYDFRLELDGTLKSWAVPKGPSLDPKEKRLAVEVEDHPLAYADFEGTIPSGNYGAGTVIVWDRGEWVPLGDPQNDYVKGKLKFELRGSKLHGGWTLVRIRGNSSDKKNNWLLIKEQDDAAKPAAEINIVEAMPDSVLSGDTGRVWQSSRGVTKAKAAAKNAATTVKKNTTDKVSKKTSQQALPKGAMTAPLPLTLAPQLAMLVDAIPGGSDWSYEVKFDGYRLLARIDGDDIRLFTRNGNDWTAKLKHLAKAFANMGLESGWLDGEIVVAGPDKPMNFQALQNAFENSRTGNIQYYLFDVPYLNGVDLRNVRLDERRQLLATLLEKIQPPIFFSQTLDMPARNLFKHACETGLEGLIGKRNSSGYLSARSRDWIKLKCLQRQEFVIGGYTDSKRPLSDSFGSLLLGLHEKNGQLRYVGRVGTGFSDTSLRQLIKKMKPLACDTMPFDIYNGDRPTRTTHWIDPKLVAEVAFGEWTDGGHIRHASFQGLRSDKLAGGITAEIPVAPPSATVKKAAITITHGDRVIDPSTGTTKQQLVDFYQEIAPRLLMHLHARPVSLVRAPNGIDGQLFFQKHLANVKIAHISEIDPDYFPEHPPLLGVESETAVIACTQMNTIEFHTWNANIDDGEHADRMIFDLDPGEGITWNQVRQGTELMKVMLDQLKLKSFLKTSGGKGLHVVVPLIPVLGWDEVKEFSGDIVRHLAKTLPTLFVAKSGPRNRVGRIFIDYLRNGRGATTVSAFSARARPGLGISIPVEWDELPDLQSSDQWTIANAGERLAKPFNKVWAGYAKSAQRLDKAMAALREIADD